VSVGSAITIIDTTPTTPQVVVTPVSAPEPLPVTAVDPLPVDTNIDISGLATTSSQVSLLNAINLLAKLSDTQPVSIASIPLATGAATEATLLATFNLLAAKLLYEISDVDDAAYPAYYGYIEKDGAWYIMEENAGAFRYAKGASNYTTSWTNRAALVYDYYDAVF
jgi:hypothetical protein